MPFLLQSISFEKEKEIGSLIKENMFGEFLFFSSPKYLFLMNYFIKKKSPMLFFLVGFFFLIYEQQIPSLTHFSHVSTFMSFWAVEVLPYELHSPPGSLPFAKDIGDEL